MITVQQAVSATLDYIKQFEKVLPMSGIRLEEFDFDYDDGVWRITMSFTEPQITTLVTPPRLYKTFSVNAEDGKVMSMKIRNPLAPSPQ